MRDLALALATVLACAASPARSAEPTIGLAAPLTGPSELLGAQMRAGAEAGARKTGATLAVADDQCSAEGGASAARAFIEAKVAVATGFLCTEAIEAALPLLKDAGIATLATGVRTNALTDRRTKTGWLVARFAPRADAETQAASDILGERWRGEHFAIVDDGTIYSRELAEGFRAAIERKGLKAVLVDTFRPQLDNQIGLLGRLRRAGATHVFVAGDRTDVAVMGRDAAGLAYPLTIAGGEVLRAAGEELDLTEGTLMIGLPEWADIADPATVAQMREAGVEPEGYVLPAFASVEIAAEALQRAAANGTAPIDTIQGEEFQTALGTIGFSDAGDRTDNPYRLFRYAGGKFEMVE